MTCDGTARAPPASVERSPGSDPEPSKSRASWASRLAFAAVAVATVTLAAVTLVAVAPIWPCAMLEHFRVQYVGSGLILVGAAAVLRARGHIDVAAIATLVNALWIAADLCRAPQPIPADD